MTSYIERSLGNGETIIARTRFHWISTLIAWIALLAPGMALLTSLHGLLNRSPIAINDSLVWDTAIAGLGFLGGSRIFLRLIIRRWTTEIGVTNHRFVEKFGLLSQRTNEIALVNIEGVRVSQSRVGRILDYGIVRIDGTGIDTATTPTIAGPAAFMRAIQTAREYANGR